MSPLSISCCSQCSTLLSHSHPSYSVWACRPGLSQIYCIAHAGFTLTGPACSSLFYAGNVDMGHLIQQPLISNEWIIAEMILYDVPEEIIGQYRLYKKESDHAHF